jgi:hypothetical protein
MIDHCCCSSQVPSLIKSADIVCLFAPLSGTAVSTMICYWDVSFHSSNRGVTDLRDDLDSFIHNFRDADVSRFQSFFSKVISVMFAQISVPGVTLAKLNKNT